MIKIIARLTGDPACDPIDPSLQVKDDQQRTRMSCARPSPETTEGEATTPRSLIGALLLFTPAGLDQGREITSTASPTEASPEATTFQYIPRRFSGRVDAACTKRNPSTPKRSLKSRQPL